jgi:hypothetical protein
MVESMSNFAISLLIVVGYYWVTLSDLNAAFSLTTGVALFFMFPIFTMWSLAGLLARKLVLKQRLLINLGVSVVGSGGFLLFLLWATDSSRIGSNTEGAATLIEGAVLVGAVGVIAGLITYRFVLDDNKPRLSKTAYTTINTAAQVRSAQASSSSRTSNRSTAKTGSKARAEKPANKKTPEKK